MKEAKGLHLSQAANEIKSSGKKELFISFWRQSFSVFEAEKPTLIKPLVPDLLRTLAAAL